MALFVKWKKGREIGTMRWCVPCTAIRWGAEMRSSRKVVALVRVARANAEERGERVGAPRCETGTKWHLADAQSGRKAMSQPKEGEADDEARAEVGDSGECELLLP